MDQLDLLGFGMTDDPQLGWTGDHVGTLTKLQTAVRVLAEGRGTTVDRLEKVTLPLVGLRPESFPELMRKRAARVLALRGNAAAHIGNFTYFRFGDMTPTERVRFVDDLIALYEACLIDIGRTWPHWDFMYPKEKPSKNPARRMRSKSSRL